MFAGKVAVAEARTDDRFACFDIKDRHQGAFVRISEILHPHAESLAKLYLDGFLSAAGIVLDDEARAVQNSRLSEYIRTNYAPPIDTAWVARVAKMGHLQFNLGTPTYANLGALSRSHRRSAELIFDNAADPVEGRYLVEQFMRVAAFETEIMVSTVQDLKDRAFDERLAASANDFQSSIAGIASSAGERSTDARRNADAVTHASHALLALSNDVAASAVQSTSAMAEAARMSGGIRGAIDTIDTELATAFDSFADLSATAAQTVASARRLADHEKSIERIVKQIRDIADQTSILSLNALIEAASAGAAGAGFAVVANEMKVLAGQTNRATQDISGQLSGIGEASQESIAAHGFMQERFGRLRETAGNVRASFAEQTRSVTAIAACIDETAQSTEATARSIAEISKRAEHVSRDIAEVTGNVAEVDRSLRDLGNSAQAFLADLTR